MGAGHNHGHTATEAGRAGDFRKKLLIAFLITVTVLVAQAIGAVITGSLALLTDTAHALADASGLLVSLIAATLMLKPANPKKTWGFRRIEVIAALGQSVLLLVVGCYAAIEGIHRLFEPPKVPATEMLIFGIIGLVANIIAITILSSSRDANFNMRAAFLEVLNDALGSLGVIIAAIVIATTGYQQADTFAGLFIAALIVPRALKLMRETVGVLMEFTPKGLDLENVREHMLSLEYVKSVHDLHASTVATGLPILTAHVIVSDGSFTDETVTKTLQALKECVAEHFDVPIHHSTFQLETETIAASEHRSLKHS